MKPLTFMPLLLGLLVSCGGKVDEESETTAEVTYANDPTGSESPEANGLSLGERLAAHFRYTSDFAAEDKLFLTFDMKNLANWSDTSRPEALAKLGAVTGLTTVNAETLSQWYMDRVTYLYPDNSSEFDIGLIIPAEQGVYRTSFSSGAANGVAALNISASLFQILAQNQDQGVDGLQFLFDGDYLPFRSTHEGIVKIGPNLFSPDDTQEEGQQVGTGYRLVKSLFRLNVLMHEARHSDGNTAAGSFGFAHVLCPDDGSVASELVGLSACDKFANGAYNVGGQVISALIGICDKDCSPADTGGLDAARIDVLSRILVDDVPENYGDGTPEAALPTIDTSAYSILE